MTRTFPALLALAAIACALAVFIPGPAHLDAAYPGRNGVIAFIDSTNSGISTMSDVGFRRQSLTSGQADASPHFSPDGRMIAFERLDQVWVINANGTEAHMVIDGDSPTWTPDGNLLIITADSEIERVSPEGSVLANLSNTAGILENEAAMSPDGQYIAYTSNEDPADADPDNAPTAGASANLWIMSATGTGRSLLWENTSGQYRGHLDWAPDSSRLAFIDDGDVWTTPPDANNQTNVTNDTPQQDYPAWSPDGTEIAYTQFPNTLGVTSEIHRINVDTRATANITNDPNAHDLMPSWQPWQTINGRLAFFTQSFDSRNVGEPAEDISGLGFMDPDGTHRSYFNGSSDTTIFDRPAWSPDGTRLAIPGTDSTFVASTLGLPVGATSGISPSWFPDNRRLLVSLDGDLQYVDAVQFAGSPVNLTNTGNGVTETTSAVSPDGRSIAFTSNESPGDDPFNPTSIQTTNLWLMDSDGITRMPIVQSATYQGFPSWSPDGTRIAYGDKGDIWTVDPFNPIDRTNLTNDDLFQASPAWSPDGSVIAFMQGASFLGNSQIWTIDPQTKSRTRLTEDPQNQSDSFPTWQPLFAPGSDGYYVWGDNGCTGRPEPAGVLTLVRFLAGVSAPTRPGCPPIGEHGLMSTNTEGDWGDTDCSGHVDGGDVIDHLAYIVEDITGKPVQPQGFNPDCPRIGDYIEWIPLPAQQP